MFQRSLKSNHLWQWFSASLDSNMFQDSVQLPGRRPTLWFSSAASPRPRAAVSRQHHATVSAAWRGWGKHGTNSGETVWKMTRSSGDCHGSGFKIWRAHFLVDLLEGFI